MINADVDFFIIIMPEPKVTRSFPKYNTLTSKSALESEGCEFWGFFFFGKSQNTFFFLFQTIQNLYNLQKDFKPGKN